MWTVEKGLRGRTETRRSSSSESPQWPHHRLVGVILFFHTGLPSFRWDWSTVRLVSSPLLFAPPKSSHSGAGVVYGFQN
jgi:hypothetical protein